MGQLARRETAAVALILAFALAFCAAKASADHLSLTFTEGRANVGVQLDDDPLFSPPATAPFAASIDPGSGAISGGELSVPQFSTHITDPLNADVTVDFEIGVIGGSFDPATGALTLEGEAGGTLTADGKQCTVATDPPLLILSTVGSSGGASPRFGSSFAAGLTGSGAIAGQWTDMTATPAVPGDGISVCQTVDDRIGGPGGIWLQQQGDIVPPAAPQLTGTVPAPPSRVGVPRILGSAEPGSTVRLFASPGCAGAPLATASAAELGSPGLTVEVTEGVTAMFSATATDAAGNTSACSVPIAYTRTNRPLPPPPPACVAPNLVGKTLARAKSALAAAGCSIGKVTKPKPRKGKRRPTLVVKSQNPQAGTSPASGKVNVRLGPKPRKHRA